MAHSHAHNHPGNQHDGPYQSAAGRSMRRLAFVFVLTIAFAVAEIAGGWLTGSLALLADGGHMLTDALGLGMALGAVWIGSRPASTERTYGYYRIEILAALLNAIILFGVAGYVLFQSVQRLMDPQDVEAAGMVAIAVAGLAVNIVGLWLLQQGSRESLNMRGAYLEVLSDALGSIAAIVAGIVILLTGWLYADALVGAGLALFIVPRTAKLAWSALHVLIEGTPAHINVKTVEAALLDLPNVLAVHDLHIWTITSGMEVLSAHVVVDSREFGEECLAAAGVMLRERFGIDHATMQIESPQFEERGLRF